MHSTRKASDVRNTEPMLCKERTLSNTTAKGNFSAALNSSALMRFNSVILSLRIFFSITAAKILHSVHICVNNRGKPVNTARKDFKRFRLHIS